MKITEELKDLFFGYEDSLQEKSVLYGIPEIDDIFAGVFLNPEFYDEDGSTFMKVSITIECHTKSQEELDEIDDDIKEEISDLVNDYLMGSCDLYGELRKLNFDPELLNWWPVNFSAV